MRSSDWSSDVCSSDLARARIDAVTPGKTVQLEQVGIVELEIEAVLVGYLAGVGTVGRDHRLHCRLDHLLQPPLLAHPGIAPLGGELRKEAAGGLAARRVLRIDVLRARHHAVRPVAIGLDLGGERSEEHTSEL